MDDLAVVAHDKRQQAIPRQVVRWVGLLSPRLSSHPKGLLHFDGLEVNAGVDGVQLAVQGVEGRPLGGFGRPAVHHDAVDVLRAAGRTWQAEA